MNESFLLRQLAYHSARVASLFAINYQSTVLKSSEQQVVAEVTNYAAKDTNISQDC